MKLTKTFNSEFGIVYSQLFISDSCFLESRKVNQLFLGDSFFYFNFQNNSENPERYKYVGDKSSDEFENWLAGHISHKVISLDC